MSEDLLFQTHQGTTADTRAEATEPLIVILAPAHHLSLNVN